MTPTDSTTLARPATRSLAIVPLRVFLGATFVDAGLGKLLSAAYLGTGPRGFAAQARGFARGSPIGWLVRAVALPHPMAAGLLLAVAELAIGLLTLVGLASRAAAAGGLALSFTFFLTASWHTRPFFYGPDLPFAAGWLVLLLAGHAGLPSLDRRLARRQRVLAGLGDDREVAVPLDRVQQVGADVAAAERLLGGDADGGGGLASLPSQPTQPTRPSARRATPGNEQPPSGTRIGSLGDIAVGHAAAFTTPSGRPAVAVRLGERQVVAFSAVCTHAGCTVGYDSGSRLLACPCHGAEFDPARGAAAVAGPTSTPLPAITLHLASDGGLYLPHSG